MSPDWYKDAIIYEVHVRGFYDSNADGIGDFPGLTEKLPYLHDLGVTCLWLLPFYPSPLRDDGYDIADYTSINPIYGTLDDFKRFVDAAHALQIRVLTELVINHTSDQHPWFQRARRAPKGSPERAYYVWSDTDTTYAGTRVIFTDTEKSNWTYDPVAGQYYWHRFFSHQPDLNLDNPEVLQAMVDAMRFWLDLGVDALRLDAIPYLVEREGTINENLPETHAILKRMRREVDARYPDRALLADANQWPSDVQAYFGEGDECHMAFHVPLMPRMFMALRQEERHPIVEIMNQTPEIPPSCQWAIFLRNHDELTLEMVTDEERDYMYTQYAADPQMRLNVGIRRRLAPLMENSRRRIELMNSLLFSMPGTPIMYFGDEIGMGDNVYLGDRNGVRTPMQWSSDRNAGFSRADPARLFAPVIMDPVYGYEAINVEAQERSPFSLLHWMKRMIALRRQHAVFGRGSLQFISAANRKIFVYIRKHEDDTVLCVANLSRTVQPAEIPLAEFEGLTPVEMLGQTEFPRIGEQPYFLTLAPYGFYWFQLKLVVTPITARTAPVVEEHGPLPSVLAGAVWESTLDGGLRTIVERRALVPFLERQRWFGGKARAVASARVADWATLRGGALPAFLTIVEVDYRDGGREQYVLPLAMSEETTLEREHPAAVLARITGARKGLLYDGLFDDDTCTRLLGLIEEVGELPMRRGRLRTMSHHLPERVPPDLVRPIVRTPLDQSNTSVFFGKRFVMKLFRRTQPGPNPDLEMSDFLPRHGFTRVPPLGGAITYARNGEEPAAVAMLQQYMYNQGTGWHVTIEELGRYFERVMALPPPHASPEAARDWVFGPHRATPGAPSLEAPAPPDEIAEAIGTYLTIAGVLGRRTGELHVHLAVGNGDAAFAPIPLGRTEVKRLVAGVERHAADQLALVERALPQLDDRRRELAERVLARRRDLLRVLDESADVLEAGQAIRCHGDFHLGQVLVHEGDVILFDFEGEPARPLSERRAKMSPLRDVAGMLRSFSYAALTALSAATLTRAEDVERLAPWADAWETRVSGTFLHAYLDAVRQSPILPPRVEDLEALLAVFVLDKALYELGYELNNRPDWVHIPLAGLLRLPSPLVA
ncbi:MAG: maltose alpha-D-glucosyltransferase [Acidobacteria bacterium]|nr:maltose alpha-D-glucosyltransferase [Acidobacteriota bacterium]